MKDRASQFQAQLEDQVKRKSGTISQSRLVDRYSRWCRHNGGVDFPVSYSSLAGFLCMLVIAREGSSSSVDNDLAAISRRSKQLDQSWLSGSQLQSLKDLLAAMKLNGSGTMDRKRPLQLRHLREAVSRLDLTDARKLQEATILFVGHDCLLRVSELLGGLTVKDVLWKVGRDEYSIWLRRSKCNRSGSGEWVTCRDYGGVNSISLLRSYLSKLGIADQPDALLFPSRSGKAWVWDRTLSDSWLRGIIKRTASELGMDPTAYSTHSLRAGGATDLFVARVPYFAIKKMGRWKSDSAMLYYRCEEDVCDAVTEAFRVLGEG